MRCTFLILLLMGVPFLTHAQQSEKGVDSAPFSTGKVVRRVSHREKHARDGSFLAKDRSVDASFNDLGSPSLSMLLQEFMIDTSMAYGAAPEDQESPSVAFDGTNYLVVWDDHRNGSDYDIYGARVTTSGTVLDSSGIAISIAVDDQCYASIAFDGTDYLVVWADYRNGNDYDIYGARVTTSGTVLDSSGIAISTAADYQEYPSVAFDGTKCFVVWQDYRSGLDEDIYGARVNANGTVQDPAGKAISTDIDYQECPSVAFDGTNYLVAWEDYRNGSDYDVYGARVNASGTVLDPSGIGISTATGYQEYPAVAFDGTNYIVVCQDYRSGSDEDIHGARVTTLGIVLDSLGILISIAPGAQSQYAPSVASDGTNYLVVWQDDQNGLDDDIYGARVTASGTVLDPSGIPISTAADYQESPSVAFDGTNYLVVWQDFRGGLDYDVYGARVDTSGTVLDSSGIPISTAADYQESPSVAFDGNNYLVVWQDYRGGLDYEIYGARVDTSGTVLDPSGIAMSTDPHGQYYPSVAFNGSNYLVVWQDGRSGLDDDIYGARVDTSGTVLDSSGIVISAAAGYQESPSAAFSGTEYLIVWEDYRNGSAGDIYGARVDTSGTVPDSSGIVVCTAASYQEYPSVTFDGTDYFVVWQDYRSGSDDDIYGARVNTSGTVLDPSGIELINQPYSREYPVIAGGSGNGLLLVHQGLASDPYNTDRVFGAFYPEVGVEDRLELGSNMPQARLEQNRPNPFSQSTVIRYQLPVPSHTDLRVYDISGRLVRTLVDGEKGPGFFTEVWDGADDRGNQVTSGIYFCELRILAENGKVDNFRAAQKLILLR